MTNTREYELFRKNFDKLCEGIGDALGEVAAKAFAKRLISSVNVEKAGMPTRTVFERSSDLVRLLLSRIERNTDEFYTILDIFKSIPVLENVVKILDPQYQAGNAAAPVASQSTVAAPGSSSKLLERPSVKQAYKALTPVADKWKQIGTFLEMPPGRLGCIQNDNNSEMDRLLALINAWLTKVEDVNWNALIEAVEMVNEVVANDIKKKYS